METNFFLQSMAWGFRMESLKPIIGGVFPHRDTIFCGQSCDAQGSVCQNYTLRTPFLVLLLSSMYVFPQTNRPNKSNQNLPYQFCTKHVPPPPKVYTLGGDRIIKLAIVCSTCTKMKMPRLLRGEVYPHSTIITFSNVSATKGRGIYLVS